MILLNIVYTSDSNFNDLMLFKLGVVGIIKPNLPVIKDNKFDLLQTLYFQLFIKSSII